MSTYVPEHLRDTAWYIFNKKYLCRVSNIQTRSIDHIALFGSPTCGDPARDRDMADQLIDRMLTINEMVEFFKQGITIRVANVRETKSIYEHITDHLNYWKRHLEESWHTRGAPIDDLILLDRFANVVYRHAVYQFTTEIVESLLARRMSSVMTVNRNSIMGNKAKVVTINANGEKEVTEAKIPERESMAEAFAGKKAGISGASKWR